MKPNELMVGDWVYQAQFVDLADPNLGHGWKPVKVTSIPFDKDCFIEPIPLTEEKILERNGFKQRNKYYFITIENKDTRYCVEYDTESKKLTVNNVWFVINELRYVHELQHAMKLCGIDINIEL